MGFIFLSRSLGNQAWLIGPPSKVAQPAPADPYPVSDLPGPLLNEPGSEKPASDSNGDHLMFQIVRLELDWGGDVIAQRTLQPLFELREDAMALAEFDASRCEGEYGHDDTHQCWWAFDSDGRRYRFV